MKRTVFRLLATIVCALVVVMVIYYIRQYSNDKYYRILRTEQEKEAYSVGKTNFTALRNIHTECSQLTFSFVPHITQPHFDKRNATNIFLLVLITSGVEKLYSERRNNVRRTWGSDAGHQASKDWKRVFLLGNYKTQDAQRAAEIQREASEFDDILVLNMTDNYNNLVIKIFSGMLWSMIHVNARYILKADDDVYVRIPHLITWLENYGSDKFYGGFVIGDGEVRRSKKSKNRVPEDCLAEDYYAPYCTGAFYVISTNVLPFIFQSVQRWKAFPVEDAYMGILARENGLKPVKIPGFNVRRHLADYGKCNWASAIALGHSFGLLQFTLVEKKLQETSELPRDYYKCLMNDWAGIIFLIVIPSISLVVYSVTCKLRLCQRFVCLVPRLLSQFEKWRARKGRWN